jgi:hypothetical protein
VSKKLKNRENRKKKLKNRTMKKKPIKILKKSIGSVWFYKPETEKTKPKRFEPVFSPK